MDDSNDMDKDLGPVARIKPIQVFRLFENGNIGVYVEIANKRTDIIGGKNGAELGKIRSIIKTVNNICGLRIREERGRERCLRNDNTAIKPKKK